MFPGPRMVSFFALTMRIPYRTLGISKDDDVDILNIKCDPILIGSLRGRPGFLPAYHMNKDKWITANYKETQIENLRIGQEVAITVDAISKKEFTGKVTAISGATGSKYSLVPTDNSAGNFVKIQQRIPVRIDFTDLSKEDNDKLAAGMMVVVKAKL